jgi:outer membrane lipoprotein LolB
VTACALHWRHAWAVALICMAALLSGCATPPRPAATAQGTSAAWAGRLALQTDGEAPQQQTFAAAFELKGSAQSGELRLFSPLGQTLAALAWAPGKATLRASDGTREFDSLDTLVAQVTGTPIPIAALFDWLDGRPAEVPGWHADLSQLASDGRIVARRSAPLPAATLRVALER